MFINIKGWWYICTYVCVATVSAAPCSLLCDILQEAHDLLSTRLSHKAAIIHTQPLHKHTCRYAEFLRNAPNSIK